VNPFRRSAPARFVKGRVGHAEFLAEGGGTEKNFRHASTCVTGRMGRAAALPYQIVVGRRCRAAQIPRKSERSEEVKC
jgi:hypothetical protein